MPEFGIFEDGERIGAVYVDAASAEDHVGCMESHPLPGAGAYEVKQLCPEHPDHGVDDCPDFRMMEIFLEKLKR